MRDKQGGRVAVGKIDEVKSWFVRGERKIGYRHYIAVQNARTMTGQGLPCSLHQTVAGVARY